MPLQHLQRVSNITWGLWHIEEDEENFSRTIYASEKPPDAINHPMKRLEWYAGRVLLQALAKENGIPYEGLSKDNFGKPFLPGSAHHISLSHSYPFVAATIHNCEPTGIDLEQPKEKLLRIAPRVLSPAELADADQDVIKHCVYWCAKETLIKVHGRKDLVLAKNIHVDSFEIKRSGHITGKLIVNNEERAIPLYYEVRPRFVVVFRE